MARLQDAHHALNLWLKEHDRYRQWANALAGWRAAFQQQARDEQQHNIVQQSLTETIRQLAELPPATLMLDADQVAASLAQHTAARPLRQQLSTLHSRLLPLRQRQQQLQTTEQARREEQEKLETTLAQRRLAYKEKHQQFSDVKAICELEARIVGLEEERARLQPGAPCPLCGSSEHPAVAQYRALEPGVNQARRDSLEREVKQLAEEGAQLRGQLEALLKQQVKEKEELDSLLQQEQALTSQWQTTVSGLHCDLQPQDDIPGWLASQQENEQQLYQHQQRLAWQAQQQAGEQQLRQLRQEQEQRRTQLEAELALRAQRSAGRSDGGVAGAAGSGNPLVAGKAEPIRRPSGAVATADAAAGNASGDSTRTPVDGRGSLRRRWRAGVRCMTTAWHCTASGGR
jgi:exonuclease SbcC